MLPEFGNTMERVVEIRIPAGTKMFEGIAARQKAGYDLLGGGRQIILEHVDPSWIVGTNKF